jgi:hypothetical protein
MKRKVTGKGRDINSRPALDEVGKIWLFSALIRQQELFDRAVGLVTQEHFHAHERWLSLVWEVVTSFHRKFNSLPSKNVICSRCESAIELAPSRIMEGDIEKLNNFIGNAFDMTPEVDFQPQPVLSTLQEFLEDRLLSGALSDLSTPQTPLSLSNVFSTFSETAASLATLSSDATEDPFADGWDAESRSGERISTGMPWLDRLLDGGMVPGESYGILGPTGGGKTTLSVMLTVEAAKRAYAEWRKGGCKGVPARSYHVTYEDPIDSLRLRALSYAAKIPRSRLEQMIHARDYSGLSTQGNLLEYEKHRFRRLIASGRKVPCERERFDRAKAVLSACWRVFDFSGLKKGSNRSAGQGLIEEIVAHVKQDVLKHGNKVAGLLADYVLAAAEFHVQWSGKKHEEVRHIINHWPRFMRRYIAIEFDCPVWSAQQLNTEANSCRPGTLPKSESMEGKAFPVTCDFCFTFGIAMRDGRVPFTENKHRRTQQKEPAVLMIRGDDCSIVDMSRKYSFDETSRSIKPRKEKDQFQQTTSEKEGATSSSLTPAQRRALTMQRESML